MLASGLPCANIYNNNNNNNNNNMVKLPSNVMLLLSNVNYLIFLYIKFK